MKEKVDHVWRENKFFDKFEKENWPNCTLKRLRYFYLLLFSKFNNTHYKTCEQLRVWPCSTRGTSVTHKWRHAILDNFWPPPPPTHPPPPSLRFLLLIFITRPKCCRHKILSLSAWISKIGFLLWSFFQWILNGPCHGWTRFQSFWNGGNSYWGIFFLSQYWNSPAEMKFKN